MTFESPPLFESFSSILKLPAFGFDGYQGTIIAENPAEVAPVLDALERAVASGLYAAGFVSYDAAPGLDSALTARRDADFPLLCFGLFEEKRPANLRESATSGGYTISQWRSSISESTYAAALRRIRDYIEAGDTYQVNYTLKMEADFRGDSRRFYRDLCRSQGAAYCAYMDLGRYQLLSVSPELFFSLRGGVLTARPMKGTMPRGRWPAEDHRHASELQHSSKDRAENLMIVDLLRNDLGRVSETGSVAVQRLWQLERYETLFQLTSTLKSRRRQATTMSEIFAALFPCGSVTGAPKVRTMQIISELELQPRGFYTGSIGFISPSGDAQFSVAIRTVCIDREKGRAEFGVGGGITHYSDGQQEFQECAVKSRVLVARRPEFSLLETMLHDPESGYFLYERHLDRLATSARYFGIKCDLLAVRRRLNQEVQAPMNGPHRVRLLVRPSGAMNVQVAALPEAKVKGPIGARLAVTPVDETDPFLFHKTTHRDVYERQLAAHPKCSEVLLWNTGGELTEFCTGNLVIELEGEKWTPPVASGLLAGTFRADLLENQDIRERVLYKEDVARAEQVYMINSVRKWAEIHLQR